MRFCIFSLPLNVFFLSPVFPLFFFFWSLGLVQGIGIVGVQSIYLFSGLGEGGGGLGKDLLRV